MVTNPKPKRRRGRNPQEGLSPEQLREKAVNAANTRWERYYANPVNVAKLAERIEKMREKLPAAFQEQRA